MIVSRRSREREPFGEFEEAAELLQQVMGELYPEPGDVQARLAEMEAHEALGSFGTRSEDRRVVAYSGRAGQKAGQVRDVLPVIAGNVRWERPTARSFWNALTDSERNALAAAGVEEVFRAGSVLCREGDDSSDVMIIDSGWVKVSVKFSAGAEAGRENRRRSRPGGFDRRAGGIDHAGAVGYRYGAR